MLQRADWPFSTVEARRNLKSALMVQDPVELFRLIGVGLGLGQTFILVVIIRPPEILSPIATGHDFISCPKMLGALHFNSIEYIVLKSVK